MRSATATSGRPDVQTRSCSPASANARAASPAGSVTTRRSTPRARASSISSRSRPIPALGRYVVGRRSRVNRAPAGSAASRASRSARTVSTLARSSSPRTSATDAPGSPCCNRRGGPGCAGAVRRPEPEPHRRAGVAALEVHLVGQVPHELHTPPAEARVGGRGPPRAPVLHDHGEGAVAVARDLVGPVAGRTVAVGVLDGVRRGLPEREEQVVGLVVGQGRGRRPPPDRAAHHGELRRIAREAAAAASPASAARR